MSFKDSWLHLSKVAPQVARHCEPTFLVDERPENQEVLAHRPTLPFPFWEKTRATRFVHAKSQVLMEHEDVLAFSKGGIGNRASNPMTYNPQGLVELPEARVSRNGGAGSNLYKTHPYRCAYERRQTHTNYPRSVLRFPSVHKGVHPTQKPVALFDWIVRTYSNPGDVVLDNTMGSGTTGCAAVAAGRKFIGIERDPEFFGIAKQRIEAVGPVLIGGIRSRFEPANLAA